MENFYETDYIFKKDGANDTNTGDKVGSLLFREEVLHAQSAQWLGAIRLGRRPGFALVTGVALALVIALLTYAVVGQATRKSRVAGVLLPTQGLLHLALPQNAMVRRLLVQEGDAVQAGQLLAVLHTGQATTQGDTASLVALSLAQRRTTLETERQLARIQAQARAAALADRLASLQRDIGQAEGELESAQRRLALAVKNVERYQQLSRDGYMADTAAQAKQEEWLDQQMRERNARRTLEGLKREATSVQAEQASLQPALQTQIAQTDRALASLAQEGTENAARAELTLVAPRAGKIGALNVHEGQFLPAGLSVMALVPDAPGEAAPTLQAELYAPSRTAGFIQPGQSVWLRLAAFPYQKFGMVPGQVHSVSRTPLNAQDLPVGQTSALLGAAQANEPLYRITVALSTQQIAAYGQAQPLKAGMTLDADVVQDRRAIWEWVLEPLLSVRTRAQVSYNDLKPSSPEGRM